MVLTYHRSCLQILRWQLINQQWRKLPSPLLLTSKGKGKVPFPTNPSVPFQNVPTPAPVVSKAPPLPPLAKTATVKPTPAKVATKPQAPKQAPKSFAQAARSGNPQSTPIFEGVVLASFFFLFKDL